MGLNSKRQSTYDRIWAHPSRRDIEFSEVEKLLIGIGCTLKQGSGSRVSFVLGANRLKMHRPHRTVGKPTLKTYQVEDVRTFLTKIGHDIYGGEADEKSD